MCICAILLHSCVKLLGTTAIIIQVLISLFHTFRDKRNVCLPVPNSSTKVKTSIVTAYGNIDCEIFCWKPYTEKRSRVLEIQTLEIARGT